VIRHLPARGLSRRSRCLHRQGSKCSSSMKEREHHKLGSCYRLPRPVKALPVLVSCVLNRKFRVRVSTELVDKTCADTPEQTLRPNILDTWCSRVAQPEWPLNGPAEPCNRRQISAYSLADSLHTAWHSKLFVIFPKFNPFAYCQCLPGGGEKGGEN
jgi:hypothetical protein